jgi:vitamin B12 transporter
MNTQLGYLLMAGVALPALAATQDESALPITVTATHFKESPQTTTTDVTVVTRDQISRHQWLTLSEVLRNQPSIEIRSNGGKGQSTTVYMRGFSAAQTLILVDGMRQSRGSMGAIDLSSIPLNQVERIEIIRGARASIYGADAVAGVVNIITRSQPGTTSHQLDAGMGNRGYANADWSSTIATRPDNTLKAGAAYSREDGYNVHPYSGNDGDKHGYWSKNALLNDEFQINDQWRVFGSARLLQMQTEYDGYGIKDNLYTQDQSYQATLETSQEHYQGQWVIQYADTDYLSGYTDDQSRDDATYKTYTDATTLGWYNLIPLDNGIALGGGLDWREERLKPGSAFTAQTHNVGEYALLQYQHADWSAELSGRNDDNSAYGTHQTWRAGTGWNVLPDYRLTANYSTSFRAPSFVDLYYPDYGNTNLKPEQAKGGELGVEGTTADVRWKVKAYRSIVQDMIESDANYIPQNIGQATLQGIELEGHFSTGWIRHGLSADFSNPRNDETGKQLRERARRSYKWQMETSWQKWDLAGSWVYQGERYANDTNTATLGGYSLWDVSVGYHLLPQLRLSGRVDNLFNHDYETASGYPSAGRSYYLNMHYQL